MDNSPPPPPAAAAVQMPPWLLLSRIHRDGAVSNGASFTLTPIAPPGVSTITLSRSVFLRDTGDAPFILAADDLGQRLLVLNRCPNSASRIAALRQEEDARMLRRPSSSSTPQGASLSPPTTAGASSSSGHTLDLPPSSSRYSVVVCDVFTRSALWIPTPGVDISDADNVGIVSAPGGEAFVIAKLDFEADHTGTCRVARYWSSTGRWTTTVLAHPHPQPAPPHGCDSVFAHAEKLYWVYFELGIYSILPFARRPVLDFTPTPAGYALALETSSSVHQCRCISVSRGMLRLAVTEPGPAGSDVLKLWTLNNSDSGGYWSCDYMISFADIWSDVIYRASGLPETKPQVCIVDPLIPHKAYLVTGHYIFSINLRDGTIIDGIIEPLSSKFLLVWAVAPLVPRVFPDDMPMPDHTVLYSFFWNIVQRLQELAQDGESAFIVGVGLSRLAAQLTQLNRGLTRTSEGINYALPTLEFLGNNLGGGPHGILLQNLVTLLKCTTLVMGRTNIGLAFAATTLSSVGLNLQQRHPSAQMGGTEVRRTASLTEIITVQNIEQANEVVAEWMVRKVPVIAEVDQSLAREDACQIHEVFVRASAYDLIRDSDVLLAKVQDTNENDWFII